nr:hypothetical protein [Tanacetum cinerariifolium]
GIISDGLGLEEEEAVPEGQQRAAPVVETDVGEPLGLGYEALRQRELVVEEDQATHTHYMDRPRGRYSLHDVLAYPPPTQTRSLPEWLSGSLHVSPAPFVVPLPISSPMISLTVPSPITSLVATLKATILVDDD